MKQRVQKARKTIHRVVEEELGEILGHLEADDREGTDGSPCPKLSCAKRERYRALLAEAIRDLEDTRRSFRSARLGALRKRLQQALDALQGGDPTR